jgi:hypothetical protein
MKAISSKYPNIAIRLASHENLVQLFKTEGEANYSLIVRSLVRTVLIDETKWSNYKDLNNKYPEQLAACVGKNFQYLKY